MTRRRWPMVSMLLCFICLTAYMVVNDLNYRMDTAYRGIQVKTYQTYSYWHRYIGTLKGLLLETDGFGETLDTATALERRTKLLIAELRADSARTDPEIRKSIDAFTGSIEGGIKIGQEVIDTGYLFLNQPDLPPGFREGRVGLSSLSGRDATAFLGKRSAYRYYQLIRKLKGLNGLFDQLYSDRLDTILGSIAAETERVRRGFFLLRFGVLAVTVGAVLTLIVLLYQLNRFLRTVAQKTKEELSSTKSHLVEVQGFLHNAQFQQSLFEMVAGISHELNTPLGNCMSAASFVESRIAGIRNDLSEGALSRDDFEKGITESLEGAALLRGNLDRMKLQIDTFKRLSSVNHEDGGGSIPVDRFLDDELPRLAAKAAPEIDFMIVRDLAENPEIKIRELGVIMDQLIDNVREHANATAVTAVFRLREGGLEIEFEDNGRGIDGEALPKIASPFFTTARGKNHMGLGLSIVSSLVINKLRGTIGFFQANPGLRIVIHLPLESII